jgi:acid phosphatase (class A)
MSAMSVRVGFGVAGAACLALIAGLVVAQNDQPAAGAGYLTASAVDGTALLGPPPAPGSPRERADRQFFLSTRQLQGSPRWALAARDNDLRAGVLQRFSCAVGAKIDRRATPNLARLLYRMEFDVRTIGTPPKDHFARKRPLIGNALPICVPRADWMVTNASYPSGHAMLGWSWALVLSEMAPDRTDVLLRNGRDFGQSRAICGVHYQSDVDAGRVLGAAMLAREHAEPQFQTDFAAARTELTAARAAGAPTDCADYAG